MTTPLVVKQCYQCTSAPQHLLESIDTNIAYKQCQYVPIVERDQDTYWSNVQCGWYFLVSGISYIQVISRLASNDTDTDTYGVICNSTLQYLKTMWSLGDLGQKMWGISFTASQCVMVGKDQRETLRMRCSLPNSPNKGPESRQLNSSNLLIEHH